ncbi:MAG: MATE family efflux transporter [Pyrinomonadaceae bacterium]|nr:MATE family efflux transporter [Pyrinomonadaceae bacterium]
MPDSAENLRGAAGEGATAEPGLWASLKEALRGSQSDYTEGPIGRAILLLSVPMVLEMVMESVFAVVDVFFVAKLGASAVAAVGLTESMLTIVYAVALGLSIGATATVARRIGEGDAEGASRAAVQAIILGIIISLLLGIAGVVLAPRLLALMGATQEVIDQGTGYARVMLGGNVVIMLLFLINAVFRGAGDAAIAMRVLWLANLINILLGPCFIFGLGPFPELGVAGAAVATTIGRGTGALYALSKLLRPGGRVQIARRHLQVDFNLMTRLLRLSASATFQVFIGMASWIGLIRILSGFGSDALAGFTIGMRVIMFALLPSWGMSNAAATMVGQALGAGKPERAERAVWLAGFYNMCFLGLVGLLFIIFAEPIVGLFTTEAAVLRYGKDCLRVVAAGFLFYAYGMVLTQSLNGAGDTRTPTIINLFVFWLWEIPLAYVLAIFFGLGPHGVFIAMTIAFSTLALVSALVFRRGSWKLQKV